MSARCQDINLEEDKCRLQLFGQLLIDGKQHTIEPVSIGQNSSSEGHRGHHKVKLVQDWVDFTSDYLYPDNFDFAKQRKVVRNTTESSGRSRRQAVAYYVEILSVTDFPIFQYWYDRSVEDGHEAKTDDAIDTILFFQAHLFNAMDVRYQSISAHTSAYTISPQFMGIFIANESSQSQWTENLKVSASPRDQVEAGQSLQEFRNWLGTEPNIPDYDHAMAFTGYDLTSGGSTVVAGLAYVGAVCGSYGVSISEDHFHPGLAIIASHELGHNLNSQHDGNGNLCPDNIKNIMSASSGPSTDSSTNTNHYSFSSCSVDYFTDLIDELNANNVNCMANTAGGYDPAALDVYTETLPGENFHLDDQCRSMMDTDQSYFCRWAFDDPTLVCQYIYCAIPGTSSCSTKFSWDGTQCGNGKMCINGQCVVDSRAPTSWSDSCPFGDQSGIVSNGQSCSVLVSNSPVSCYEGYSNHDRCCGSCAEYYTCEPAAGNKQSVSSDEQDQADPQITIYVTVATVGGLGMGVALVCIFKCVKASANKVVPFP
ncbi:metalloprotease mig-17-like [Argopecten irradians]|uniref:metalloprotease mig-17-like n=1 Tax=Argopecten irradians TaxID=31199 RepID=UPI003712001C